MPAFSYQKSNPKSKNPSALGRVGTEIAQSVLKFHSTIPNYSQTPLISLPNLAKILGVEKIWVKDESHRFGLNAFKGLGGSYAIAQAIAERLGRPLEGVSFADLSSQATREKIGTLTFVTATDGNHGRGVAWAAQQLGHKSVVYMPKGTALERLENIQKLGAEATITEMNYDDAVRHAAQMGEENGWILVQDTAWEGYEATPTHILQGYTTLAAEISSQLEGEMPTHLFLQAGVGSFAGATLGYFANLWGENCPKTVIVEPDQADCIYRTAVADDGQLHFVTGEMNSMMAGLCCGEPCTLTWEILRDCATGFVSSDDGYAARGMQILGRPVGDDPAVVSGESGAVGAGVLAGLMTQPELAEIRDQLGLDQQSKILLISTEGDTDRENYRKILSKI